MQGPKRFLLVPILLIVALAGLAVQERLALQRLIHNREQQLQAIAEDLGAEAGSH